MLNLLELAKTYKGIRGNLPFGTNLQIEQLNKQLEEYEQQLKSFLTRMHWHSLRSLGQQNLHQLTGSIYQLLQLKQGYQQPSVQVLPNNPWLHQVGQNQAFLAAIAEQQPETHQALTAVLENNDLDALSQLMATHQQTTKNSLLEISDKLTALLTKSLLSILHGNINAQANLTEPAAQTSEKEKQLDNHLIEQREDILRQANDRIRLYQQQLDKQLFSFYQYLVSGTNTHEWLNACLTWTQQVSQLLLEVGDLHNLLHKHIQLLQAANKNGFSEKIGHQAALLGRFSRQLIASVASSFRLFFDLEWQRPSPLIKELRTRPFDAAKLPDGKNTPIHKLADAKEEAFVETGGFVQDIDTLRTSRGALICRAKLYDPSSKKTVWIATLYSHLAHLGMDVGAYVVVHGTVHHQSNLAQQERAIHIDLLPLASLSEQSWKLSFLHYAEPFYQAWYNGMHLAWSLSEHQHNHQEKTFEQVGAAELMFQPLYRSEDFLQYQKDKYSTNQ